MLCIGTRFCQMSFFSDLFAGPSIKDIARKEDLNIRKAKRQNVSEQSRLQRAKDALVSDIQRAISLNNMKLAASLSQNLARVHRQQSKVLEDSVWLTECQHEVASMSDASFKQAVVNGMVNLANRQNKNLNIKKLVKQQRDASMAMSALRQGRDIMSETMDDLVDDDSAEVDDVSEGKAILDAMMDRDTMKNSDRMADVPMHNPIARSASVISEDEAQSRIDKLTDGDKK